MRAPRFLLRLFGRVPAPPFPFTEEAMRYIVRQCASQQEKYAVLAYASKAESSEKDGEGRPIHVVGEHCALSFWDEEFPAGWCYELCSHQVYICPDTVVRLRRFTIGLAWEKVAARRGTYEWPVLTLNA